MYSPFPPYLEILKPKCADQEVMTLRGKMRHYITIEHKYGAFLHVNVTNKTTS